MGSQQARFSKPEVENLFWGTCVGCQGPENIHLLLLTVDLSRKLELRQCQDWKNTNTFWDMFTHSNTLVEVAYLCSIASSHLHGLLEVKKHHMCISSF